MCTGTCDHAPVAAGARQLAAIARPSRGWRVATVDLAGRRRMTFPATLGLVRVRTSRRTSHAGGHIPSAHCTLDEHRSSRRRRNQILMHTEPTDTHTPSDAHASSEPTARRDRPASFARGRLS